MKVQANIYIPEEWKNELIKQAHLIGLNENREVTYLDLIKEAIKEKYNLMP